jgi:hypothetical protein
MFGTKNACHSFMDVLNVLDWFYGWIDGRIKQRCGEFILIESD